MSIVPEPAKAWPSHQDCPSAELHFEQVELLDQLDDFDKACAWYTESTKKMEWVLDVFKKHLLMHLEWCESFQEFRDEVGTITKAKAPNLTSRVPLDVGIVGGDEIKRRTGKCCSCGRGRTSGDGMLVGHVARAQTAVAIPKRDKTRSTGAYGQ